MAEDGIFFAPDFRPTDRIGLKALFLAELVKDLSVDLAEEMPSPESSRPGLSKRGMAKQSRGRPQVISGSTMEEMQEAVSLGRS